MRRRTGIHRTSGFGPWLAFVIIPVFALANTAVPISVDGLEDAVSTAFGLVVGKPLGILFISAIAVRPGLGNLLPGVSWLMLAGAGPLAGIRFTMAFFTAELGFEANQLLADKTGFLFGSIVSRS